MSQGTNSSKRKRVRTPKGFNVPAKQRAFEDSIRNSDVERGAYFDGKGNLLLMSEGNADEVSFDPYEMNHKVERRVWNDEEVNFTHNHPENTIFSPEDVEVFERLENHSERAVLPNGTEYTLVRIQPRSSNTYVLNPKTGELEEMFTPKKIAPAYDKEYSRVYDSEYSRIRKQYAGDERTKALADLDRKTARHMEQWLRKNASSYGYKFIKGKR